MKYRISAHNINQLETRIGDKKLSVGLYDIGRQKVRSDKELMGHKRYFYNDLYEIWLHLCFVC